MDYFSLDIAEAKSVLDWGCGCGRLTRHLKKYTESKVDGVDIDSMNIEWCSENIPGAAFSHVDPWKPLPFEDDSFDFIIGHSVFTHLSEESSSFWLDQLHRVLKPGGALLVTVMSSLAVLNDQLSGREISRLLRAGYLDVGHQPDGVDEREPGYYRKVYHRPQFIYRNWTSRFEILDILDGYAGHQALVVCKKITT
jgi:SAM-dependent methyltransferase